MSKEEIGNALKMRFTMTEQSVLKNVCLFVFFFHGIGECVQVEFVEINRVALGGEGCGSDVAQGSPQFRGGQKPHVRLQSTLRFCRSKALFVQESLSHVQREY